MALAIKFQHKVASMVKKPRAVLLQSYIKTNMRSNLQFLEIFNHRQRKRFKLSAKNHKSYLTFHHVLLKLIAMKFTRILFSLSMKT